MGAFVPALNTVVSTILFEQGGVLVSMMPSFRKLSGTPNLLAIGTFNTWLAGYVRDELLPMACEDTLYQLTQSQRQHVPSDIAASNSVGAGTAGAYPEHIANVLALRFELQTGVPGRNTRGAMYWPSIPTGFLVGDLMQEAYTNVLATKLDNMRFFALAQGWEMVIRSKYLNGALRPSCLITPVTAVVANDRLVDVQRRRKPPTPLDDGDLMVSIE